MQCQVGLNVWTIKWFNKKNKIFNEISNIDVDSVDDEDMLCGYGKVFGAFPSTRIVFKTPVDVSNKIK